MQYDHETNTWSPSILKVGMKMRNKIYGNEFILDEAGLRNLENDNLGEWWNLFEIVKE